MQPLLIAKLLVLLSIANGAPVIAKRVFGDHLSRSIDGGLLFFDGRPLFGRSKTIRGAAAAVTLTAAAALLLGFNADIGVLVGGVAVIGDLFSSLLKRRLGFAPSSRVVGLDQIPESLFPLLACRNALGLSFFDVLCGVLIFLAGAMLLSPIFYRLGIRDRPF